MKEIVFITHQMGTQGSYLNHLDLQQYLKDYENYKITFYCENIEKLYEVIKNSRRSYKLDTTEVKSLTKEIVEPEIVITDFKTLLIAKELDLWIICKKLIVMDSIELTYHLKNMTSARFYYNIDLYESLKRFYTKEIIFLMPPNNYKLFRKKYPDLNSKIFFKKINIDMLNTIKYKNNIGYFYRWDDSNNYHQLVERKFGSNGNCFEPKWKLNNGMKVPLIYNETNYIFDYKKFIYRRREYLEYQEQFGRLIFEYILLGKKVFFMGKKYKDDGLTDYLIHYNIQFNKNEITTTKKELTDQMKLYNDKPWEN